MKKILFIGIEKFFLVGIVRRVTEYAKKEFIDLQANTTLDVIGKCGTNPDIVAVILIDRILDMPFSEDAPNTIHLVHKIRDKLGKDAKIIASCSDEKFRKKLMEAGCDMEIPFDDISLHLSKIL